MSRNAQWVNSDGLVVGFGTHAVDNDIPQGYGSGGLVHVSAKITMTDVVTAATTLLPLGQPQSYVIPRGSMILRAGVQVVTACTSAGAATLDVGTWSRGVATEVVDSAAGIHSGFTIAELTTPGEYTPAAGVLVGADVAVGATSNSDCVLTWEWNTAVYTAGVIILHVEYLPPLYARTFAV